MAGYQQRKGFQRQGLNDRKFWSRIPTLCCSQMPNDATGTCFASTVTGHIMCHTCRGGLKKPDGRWSGELPVRCLGETAASENFLQHRVGSIENFLHQRAGRIEKQETLKGRVSNAASIAQLLLTRSPKLLINRASSCGARGRGATEAADQVGSPSAHSRRRPATPSVSLFSKVFTMSCSRTAPASVSGTGSTECKLRVQVKGFVMKHE